MGWQNMSKKVFEKNIAYISRRYLEGATWEQIAQELNIDPSQAHLIEKYYGSYLRCQECGDLILKKWSVKGRYCVKCAVTMKMADKTVYEMLCGWVYVGVQRDEGTLKRTKYSRPCHVNKIYAKAIFELFQGAYYPFPKPKRNYRKTLLEYCSFFPTFLQYFYNSMKDDIERLVKEEATFPFIVGLWLHSTAHRPEGLPILYRPSVHPVHLLITPSISKEWSKWLNLIPHGEMLYLPDHIPYEECYIVVEFWWYINWLLEVLSLPDFERFSEKAKPYFSLLTGSPRTGLTTISRGGDILMSEPDAFTIDDLETLLTGVPDAAESASELVTTTKANLEQSVADLCDSLNPNILNTLIEQLDDNENWRDAAMQLLQTVKETGENSKWLLADIVAFLLVRRGRKEFGEFCREINISMSTAYRYAVVALHFPANKRHKDLGYMYHFWALLAPDPHAALELARQQGWSLRRLQEYITALRKSERLAGQHVGRLRAALAQVKEQDESSTPETQEPSDFELKTVEESTAQQPDTIEETSIVVNDAAEPSKPQSSSIVPISYPPQEEVDAALQILRVEKIANWLANRSAEYGIETVCDGIASFAQKLGVVNLLIGKLLVESEG